MNELSGEVRDLLVAIRDALHVPFPADGNELHRRARLVEDRAACIRGALESVLDAGTVSATIAGSVRRLADEYPVTYQVGEGNAPPDSTPIDEWPEPTDPTDPVPARSGDMCVVLDQHDGAPWVTIGRVVRVDDAGRVVSTHIYGNGSVEIDETEPPRREIWVAPAAAFDLDMLDNWVRGCSQHDLVFPSVADAQEELDELGPADSFRPAEVATSAWRPA